MKSISYAITVCNEFVEIQKLVPFLLQHKRDEDQIVVLYDQNNGTEGVEDFLRAKSVNNDFSWYPGTFNRDFSEWKNLLTSHCRGDYIFQIDADELPDEALIKNLPRILEANPDNEVYLTPRINTVKGLTQEHIGRWQWRVNEKGWVNWPDYQWRIWQNKPGIKWANKVHEKLSGYKTFAALPASPKYALYHPKDIQRQERQNAFYNTITD